MSLKTFLLPALLAGIALASPLSTKELTHTKRHEPGICTFKLHDKQSKKDDPNPRTEIKLEVFDGTEEIDVQAGVREPGFFVFGPQDVQEDKGHLDLKPDSFKNSIVLEELPSDGGKPLPGWRFSHAGNTWDTNKEERCSSSKAGPVEDSDMVERFYDCWFPC